MDGTVQVRKLHVERLRNVSFLDLSLAPGQNFFVGGNGQGKTTILEAMYLLSAVRSFRGGRAADVISHGCDHALVHAQVSRPSEPPSKVHLELHQKGGRKVRVDGKAADLSAHFSRFPIVAFHPGDLDLVFGGPQVRRRFLDRMLFQAEPGYASWHRDYRRALQSRNELLRRGASQNEVRAFDGPLVRNGALLAKGRHRVTALLAEAVKEVLEELHAPHFVVSLSAAVEPTQEALAEALRSSLLTDMARKRTTRGPHTDDMRLARKEGRAREVASRGEARALIVALRLAERRVVSSCVHAVVPLLLDDVLAELDIHRASRVLDIVSQEVGQVFVTSTGEVEVDDRWHRFQIKEGQALPM